MRHQLILIGRNTFCCAARNEQGDAEDNEAARGHTDPIKIESRFGQMMMVHSLGAMPFAR